MSFTIHNKTQASGSTDGEPDLTTEERGRDDLARYQLGVESLSAAVLWRFLAWMAALTTLLVMALVIITHRNRIYDW